MKHPTLSTARSAVPSLALLVNCFFLVLLAVAGSPAATAVEPRPSTAGEPTSPLNGFDTDHYVPLTTSRVVGSPDPPPPYRVERRWPGLQLTWPIFAVVEPGSRRWLIIDQKSSYGKARLARTTADPDSGQLETLLDLDGVAYSLAFHPRFADNGFLYLGWNTPLGGDRPKQSKVTRYTMQRQPPFQLDPNSATTIIEWPSNGHNGAAIAFGLDGMLYVTSGDGTSDSDTDLKGQGLDHLLAKVLRIDVDQVEPGQAYRVPAENPFVNRPGARPETWAYGLRNPWRMTTDPRTGHIWVGNNGQDLWEQAYLIEPGANYGWSVNEGSHVFYANRERGPTPLRPPTVEHPHSEFRSLTGGVVYYGSRFPELQGAYVYGDYSTGKIWAAKVETQGKLAWNRELADTTLQISAFAIDAEGELIVVDHRGKGEGGLYSLESNSRPATARTFPRRLSETGLFSSVADHRVQPSLIPYSVNSPLWSDGALKERFLALPGEHPQIEVTPQRGWNFPDQTVFVKSFALELEAGQPTSRRWIETRLLTRQDGEWFGYSYAWNDEQTDAELIGGAGLDRPYVIRSQTGMRTHSWRFPSRTECMVCHSRAANFVLGATTLQLNKQHDYGGALRDQLDVWKRLGLLTNAPSDPGRLADPYDARQPVDVRARSYLHANCAHCHISAGGGNAQIDLEFDIAADKRNLFDVKPLHHTFGLDDARLVAKGNPDRSVLLYRIAHRGAGQMPQLATSQVDEPAVALLRQWIREMAEKAPATE